MEQKERRLRRLDYKWVMVGLCFMMVFVALGFCSSPKSLYILPITEALGIERSVYSVSDSFRYVSTAIVNVFFGFLVARFGPKKLILAGFSSLIISTLLYAFSVNVIMLYLAGMFLGIGLSWTATTMVGYVVTRWCKENKGTIMGAILASNGVGGAIAIQIVSPIIASSAEGYRTAYLVVAAILASFAVVLLIFFKDKPANYNEEPVATGHRKKKRGTDWVGISFSDAVKKKYFWAILFCIFFSGFILQGIWGVSAAHFRDVGIDPELVSVILSAHSLILAGAKFFTGFIYDRAGLRVTSTMCMVIAVVSAITLVMIDPSPFGIFLAFFYSTVASFALPLETVMLPIYASDLFGSKSFDKVLGIFVSVNTAGYALGGPTLNLCYDLTGSYNIGFIIAASVMAVVIVVFQFVASVSKKTREAVIASAEAEAIAEENEEETVA